MAGDLETVKNVATIAAPLTALIVETWIKPKLTALHKYLKTDKALFENALANKFDEYLLRSYEKNSYINVIVFQNQRKRLEDIYIPLTVINVKGNKVILVDGYKEEFVPSFKKVLVTDTAGMGKSTILKYLFVSCVNNNAGIPILIELRKIRRDESLLSYIYNELNPIDDEFNKDFIIKLIKQGDFIFFFDGYDEIPLSERDLVSNNLQDFISKANKNLFVLSSRPESSLASFLDFQEFNIQPLELEEAFDLLRKYDNKGELSAEIISKLQGGTLKNIKEFLENPLLVSLLYKSYEYKPIIPFKKHTFYRQVYDALFERHDLTKGGSFVREKHSQLDIEDFHRVLRVLGFITVKMGQIEFDKDTLLSLLREAKQHCPGLTFKESNFLNDLLTTVPLFNREGDYYKWTHKSIQEYFAAQFIWLDAKSNQNKILRQMVRSVNNHQYFNVLDLYYDMDYKTFRQTIIYDLIFEFIQHYDSTYTLIDRNKVPEEYIKMRKLITFGKKFIIMSEEMMMNDYVDDPDRLAEILTVLDPSTTDYNLTGWWEMGLVEYENYHDLVMRLIFEKEKNLFFNTEVQTSENDTPKQYSNVIAKETPYIIDDSPHTPWNQKEGFTWLNKIIESEGKYFLNPVKCRELKLEIEREINKETSSDFFGDL